MNQKLVIPKTKLKVRKVGKSDKLPYTQFLTFFTSFSLKRRLAVQSSIQRVLEVRGLVWVPKLNAKISFLCSIVFSSIFFK